MGENIPEQCVSVTLLRVKQPQIIEALLITLKCDVKKDTQVSLELFKQSENRVGRKSVSSDSVSCCHAPLVTGLTPSETAALTAPLRAPLRSTMKVNVLPVGVIRKGREQ